MYYKIFSEIRFPAAVDFFDIKGKVLKSYYPKEFSHFNIPNNSNLIQFHNANDLQINQLVKSKETLAISFQNFVYSIEDPITDNIFIDKYKKYLGILERILDLKNVTRLGLRGIFCLDGIEFQEILSKVQNGVLFEQNLIKELSDTINVEDFALILQNKTSRIEAGPMLKSQKHPNIYNNFAFIENIPNEFFYLDIDVSYSNIEYKNLNVKLNDLNRKLWKILNNFKKGLGIKNEEK